MNRPYVRQTDRHLKQCFKERIWNKVRVKFNFEMCSITPNENIISILGRKDQSEYRLPLVVKEHYVKYIRKPRKKSSKLIFVRNDSLIIS